MAAEIAFTLNGRATSVAVDPDQTLLDVLRNTLALKATRMGCGLGQCGACTVIVDAHAVNSCDTPMWSVAGKNVITLEGLGTRASPHPLQTAFIEEQALQCGYCTSGILMAAAALLRRNPQPSESDIRQALEGNLCRCGVHNRVVRAVQKASE
ncbi:MAG TPA: (2Fe-2S)-binding protein [Ramlibacter sp.]|nr:(2Fe-2S)-binding protein [Ramlibacter sp.]